MADAVNTRARSSWATVSSLLRPLASFGATLAGALFFVSALLYFSPGTAADVIAQDAALREALIEEWGLNDSLFQQYGAYISRAFTGDFGVSLTYRPGTPVAEIMASKAAETLTLVLTALFLSLLVGTAMAFWSAGRTRTLSRASLRLLSVPPVFLIAYLSMILLDSWAYSATVEAGEPPPGWFPLLMEDSSLKFWLAVGALALGSSALTEIHGAAEREIRRIRSSGYVDAARARGAPIWPHTLSTLLPALTTLVSSRAAFFLGGAIIVEKVFGLHGLGDVLWEACRKRDFPLVLGITLLSAAFVCGARLLADWLRMAMDPRHRIGR